MKKIYLASSWRNAYQEQTVLNLRQAGHEVYDFKNPPGGGHGFAWSAIEEDWINWTPERFIGSLNHQLAKNGFNSDWEGMEWADTCVLLLPCGRSAHLEAGYFVGHPDKELYILVAELPEPELMYKMANGIFIDPKDLLRALDPDHGKQKCDMCHRARDVIHRPMDAYEYNPIQVLTGRPVGWYSDPKEGEVCPECMTGLLVKQ